MKNLVITAAMALLSFSALSQTSSDSTLLKNSDIRTLLQIGDEWTRLKKEVELLDARTLILEERIASKDSLLFSRAISLQRYEEVIDMYKQSENNLIHQRTNLEQEMRALTKQLRKEKTKTFVGSLLGVAGAVAIIILKK